MAYKPPKQSIIDNDLKGVPSNEAVFEGLKLKLPKPSIDGTNGQLLARGASADDTSWVNPPSAGASLTLNNLTAPTAINVALLGTGGTNTAPAYSFTGDTGTGMYRISASRLGLAAGGTLIADFNSNGNLNFPQTSSITVNSGGLNFVVGATTWMSFQTGSAASAISFADRFLWSTSEASQTFYLMPSWGVTFTLNSTPNYRRPYGIFARRKLGVGQQLNAAATNGGILSSGGITEFLLPQFITADGTTTIIYIEKGDGENRGVMAYGIGVGDKLRLVRTGQPDLEVKILSVTASGGNKSYVVDQTVASVYGGTGSSVYLRPAPFTVFDQTGTLRQDIDYSGNISLNSAVVINDSGADKDTRIEGDTDANLVFVDASTDKVGIGTATPAEKLEVSGNIKVTSGDVIIATAGDGLSIKEGSNAKMGITGAFPTGSPNTVTVSTTAVTANSRIFLTAQSDPAGVNAALTIISVTAGTSFDIRASNTNFNGTVAWMIVEAI